MKSITLEAWRQCQRFCLSWWGQLAVLLILLCKITWGMWQWRDLTYGDTSYYYYRTVLHSAGAPQSLVFSPLYLAFYGWFVRSFEDAFAATLLHRLAILILLSSSLLLLARALLPRVVAWLVAAWWVVLPINWNALYEVHLFGFIPLALGCWIVVGRARRLSLSLGIALVWSGALLVRNEYALTVALLATCCMAREFFVWRKTSDGVMRLVSRIAFLALPSVLVVLLSAMEWHADWPGWKGVQESFQGRHTLNMAQVYPFSYQQQHPEWTKSPWTEGGSLMKEKFGRARITFSEAFKRNPKAIMNHVLWHLELLPAGLQLSLFNGHFGADGPDFTPPRQLPIRAAVLSSLLFGVMTAGAFCLWKQKAVFGRLFRSRRGWCWLALLCTLPPCVVAIVTQRPRPSYIFPLTFFLMAFSGLCLYAILKRLKLWRHFQALLPVFVIGILLSAFSEKTTAQMFQGQPLREMYERLHPFRDYFQKAHLGFASREYTTELFNYLNRTGTPKPHLFPLSDASEETSANFRTALDKNRVTLLYLNGTDLEKPSVTEWLRSEDAKTWHVLASDPNDWHPWMLLAWEKPVTPEPSEAKRPGQTSP